MWGKLLSKHILYNSESVGSDPRVLPPAEIQQDIPTWLFWFLVMAVMYELKKRVDKSVSYRTKNDVK